MAPLFAVVIALGVTLNCADAGRTLRPPGFRSDAVFQPDSVELAYICGNKFRVRSFNDASADVHWLIHGTSDSGTVTLPGRTAGTLFSETYIVADTTGYMLLYYGQHLIASAPNGGTTCPTAVVPPVAPDGTPDSIWTALVAPENVLVNPPGYNGRMVKNALYVSFRPGTPQSDRQTAIDAIGGEVVGGHRFLGVDGFYLVRLLNVAPVAGDSVSGPVLRAIQALDARPSVIGAIPVMLDQKLRPSYLTPRDGAGFTTWRLSPDSADGDNWGMEAIAAPWGWGCALGRTPRVDLVDEGVRSVADLSPNLNAKSDTFPMNALDHGTSTGSVLAAVGNNGVGVTGTLWKADIHAYDMHKPVAGEDSVFWPVFAIDRALTDATDSVPIVNISFSLYHKGANPSWTPNPADSSEAAYYGVQLATLVQNAIWRRQDPLLVISASNDGVDAQYAGFPTAARDSLIAPHIIVVGGVSRPVNGTWTLSSFSNRGPLVDVVAPATDVRVLDGSGAIKADDGVSFAVPQVSGVAAALRAQNPRLKASEIKQIILAGADSGKRRASDGAGRTYPLLNYYEAMKLGGARAGAPLCGNRVWVSGTSVVAERGSGTETIGTFADPGYQVSYANVFHGGQRIELDWGGTVLRYDSTARIWTPSTVKQDTADVSGKAFQSYWGVSHDSTTSLWATLHRGPTTSRVTMMRQRETTPTSPAVTDTVFADIISGTSYPDSILTVHDSVHYNGYGYDRGYWGYDWDGSWYDLLGPDVAGLEAPRIQDVPAITAIAPQGDFALVAITRGIHTRASSTPTDPCDDAYRSFEGGFVYTLWCLKNVVALDSALDTEIWRVNTVTRDSVLVADRPGEYVEWLAVSEDGREFAMGLGGRWIRRTGTRNSNFPFVPNATGTVNGTPVWALTPQQCPDERIEWVNLDAARPGVAVGAALKTVPTPGKCGGEYIAGGTIAPNRGTGPGLRLRPNRARARSALRRVRREP